VRGEGPAKAGFSFYPIRKIFLAIQIWSGMVFDMNPESVLANALKTDGTFSEETLPAIVAAFPEMKIGVKFANCERICVPARAVADSLAMRRAVDASDYIRECFIPATTFRNLRSLLGFE
jgi:hypothetical protein